MSNYMELPTEEECRIAFWDLDTKIRKIESEIKKIRDQRDAIFKSNMIDVEKAAKLGNQIKKMVKESNLEFLSKQRTRYNRLLGGKTGEHAPQ